VFIGGNHGGGLQRSQFEFGPSHAPGHSLLSVKSQKPVSSMQHAPAGGMH
jgi:hypothetical protein